MEDRFIANFILNYAEDCSTPNPTHTGNIYESTLKHPKGYMCLGPLPGFLIRAFLMVKKPMSILEIGTFTGYTLSLFKEYTSKDCKITSLDDNTHHTYEETMQTFKTEVDSGKITLVKEEGIAYLKKNTDTFDMMFLDARKDAFYDQLNLIHSRLNMDGLLICDNALAGLKVFSPVKHWEHCAVEFNEHLKNDERFVTMLLPLRDGFNIAIKVK